MNLPRILKHLFFLDRQMRRDFPPESLRKIEQAIATAEQSHSGEIRFVLEGSLEGLPLFMGKSARERAIEVFSLLRVWDTELNNGVLVYVLLADRAVEIVADRGIHLQAGTATWQGICHTMQAAFANSQFQAGAIEGISLIAQTLASYFPGQGKQSNELPDAPVLLNSSAFQA